ncbi:hypothetical protein CWI38_0325p0010 [Hamiltosporidium tvaerminnensis]|uniref:Leucine-rich repeat-containing protein n=2 Tax=Hamiltosporidium TaxID=1176354 RepID=A0A4Q9LFN5_9MICR|nr:hypothetical protein CWI36_0371p0010 [Hamiltosporidium magnivora]TBU14446.1 hypothetical protein CWI38_0325p0010 [Hamiltosporidium tvaerminnensis]
MVVGAFLEAKNLDLFWYCRILSIIVTIYSIMARRTIAIHFYEDIENILASNDSTEYIYCDACLDFFEVKYKPCSPDLEKRILKTFKLDIDNFLLKFMNEEKIEGGKQYNVYINNSLLKFDDLAYFYNIVLSIPCFMDCMDGSKYLLICKVMNIFKYINNKFFKDFIRSILVSMVFNQIETKNWNLSSPNSTEFCFPRYITDIFILELFKMYRVSEKTQNKFGEDLHEMIFDEYFTLYYINLREDFLFIDDDIIREILKLHKKLKNFLKIIDIVFRFHTFKSIFLYRISYIKEYDNIFDVSLFKSSEEINIIRCSNTNSLIERICRISRKKQIETLNIVHSTFNIEEEIAFLKKLCFRRLNYVILKDRYSSSFTNADSDSPVQFIFSRFINQIYDNDNKSNICVRKTRVCCYETEKELTLNFKHHQRKIVTFQKLEFPFLTFVFMKLVNKYISFVFYLINFKEFNNIEMIFTDTSLKDFSLRETEILNNITRIKIVSSTLNDIFLSKILLFPALRILFLSKCSIFKSKDEIKFEENTKIEKLHFGNSLVDDPEIFAGFLSKIVTLNTLEIFCLFGDTNIFLLKSIEKIVNLSKLKRLELSDTYHADRGIPFFPMFSNILYFDFYFNCPKDTFYKLFNSVNFRTLKFLNLDGVILGVNDKLALEKNTNLLRLKLSKNCKISGLAFSELFNLQNIYSLTEIRLPEIQFDMCDFLFFSKLKSLRKLYILSFTLKFDIIYFVKMFNQVKEIVVEYKIPLKDKFLEEFGSRLKGFALLY